MDDDVGDPDYEPEVEHVEEDDDEEHTDKDTRMYTHVSQMIIFNISLV